MNKRLFSELDDDFFSGYNFDEPGFEVELQGLSFNRSTIEMMQPNDELSPALETDRSSTRIGRPRTWDWDAAMTFLLTVAQKPDGLPTGPGAQAQIEKLLAEWFISEVGNAPAESHIRKHATKIIKALHKA